MGFTENGTRKKKKKLIKRWKYEYFLVIFENKTNTKEKKTRRRRRRGEKDRESKEKLNCVLRTGYIFLVLFTFSAPLVAGHPAPLQHTHMPPQFCILFVAI